MNFYTRLINREHPLPEGYIPEHLIDIGIPFDAVPGDRISTEFPATVLSKGRKNCTPEVLMWPRPAPASIKAALPWISPARR